ncbi:hypothetical protein ACI2KR_08010 [Pseudomonas luteola]
MKKMLIGVCAALTVAGVSGVMYANDVASKKVQDSIASLNSINENQVGGTVSANVLLSTISIPDFTITKANGKKTTGSLLVSGVNFFNSDSRLLDRVTVSYKNLTANDTADSANYTVDGYFEANHIKDKIALSLVNTITNKTNSRERFHASAKATFTHTDDLYETVNKLVSTPPELKQKAFKEVGFGMYTTAMHARLLNFNLRVENSDLLQNSIRKDIQRQSPEASPEEKSALYRARLDSMSSRLDEDGKKIFNDFVASKSGQIDIDLQMKKNITLLEATYSLMALPDQEHKLSSYYDVTVTH